MTSKKKQQLHTNDFDFLAIYNSAEKAVLDGLLKQWGFDEHPSADLLVTAVERAGDRTGIDDYVRKHYPSAVYDRFHTECETWSMIGSVLDAPRERMCYWAEKLGIRKAPDEKMIFDPVGRYMIAKHGWNRYRFSHTGCGTIADILEKDATSQPPTEIEPPDMLVRLSQVTPYTGTCAKTVRRRIAKGCPPDVQGGQGKADLWRWSRLRPQLESMAAKVLPITFPGDRIIP
ncbi:MAG: hypothetical protein V1790_09550 [Planctomycetota bacterium]